MSKNNGLTDSGTFVYTQEGYNNYFAGCNDDGTTPYDRSTEPGKNRAHGWKAKDWLAGLEDAKKNATPGEQTTRILHRKKVLQERIAKAQEVVVKAQSQIDAAHEEISSLGEDKC